MEQQGKVTSFQHINPPVFFISAGLIIILAFIGIFFTESFERGANFLNGAITTYFGWFLLLSVTFFIFFSLYLMLSKYGNIRLGPDDSRPDYGFWSWIAMLFSAGMGIGLMFFGVAEPLIHYANPPVTQGGTMEAAEQAMNYSFFHWGLHAWATYIIIALALAYFSFRKGLPLSIRFAFYPLLGDRIYGRVGHLIDILAVLGTLFGVATSLGFGVMQINSGLNFLTGLPDKLTYQVGLIAVITAMATLSVASGLNKGIKWLSIFNMSVGGLLLLFMIAAGPTVFIFKSLVQNTGFYLQNFIETSLWTSAYQNIDWQGNWTIFYWAWWVSWAPYVGMFIARISRGRTIREFIAVVLFLPSVLSFLWMTAFGGTAVRQALNGGADQLINIAQDNTSLVLFEFLKQYPLSAVVSGFAVLVVITFFVTSSDSGSLVVDIITSGGSTNPPLKQRIFWACLEGIVAAVLLIGGGLVALQTAAVSMGLPFAIVLLILCYSIHRSLSREWRFTHTATISEEEESSEK